MPGSRGPSSVGTLLCCAGDRQTSHAGCGWNEGGLISGANQGGYRGKRLLPGGISLYTSPCGSHYCTRQCPGSKSLRHVCARRASGGGIGSTHQRRRPATWDVLGAGDQNCAVSHGLRSQPHIVDRCRQPVVPGSSRRPSAAFGVAMRRGRGDSLRNGYLSAHCRSVTVPLRGRRSAGSGRFGCRLRGR